MQAIEHFIGQKIPRLKLENFPYLYTALFEPESHWWTSCNRRQPLASGLFLRPTRTAIGSWNGRSAGDANSD